MPPRFRDVIMPGYFLRERDVIIPSEWRYRRMEHNGLLRRLNDWDERTVPLADRLYMIGLECATIALGAGGVACAALGTFGEGLEHRINGAAAAVAAYAGIRMADALRIHYNRRSIWKNAALLRKRATQVLAKHTDHNHIENKYYFGLQQVGSVNYPMTYDFACDRCTDEVRGDDQPPLYALEKPTEMYGRYRWRLVPEVADPGQDGFDDSA